jgi:hypothetical protein
MVAIRSPFFMGRAARRLGEDAYRVADQRALTEVNYVHSTVNTVHLSRSAFNKGDGAAGGRPPPRQPVTPAPPTTATDRRLASLCSPNPAPAGPLPPQSSPCRRVVAEVLVDFTDRGSKFSSSVCVPVCDRAGAGAFHRLYGSCLDNAVAESFFATSGRARRPPASPHPRRTASLDLPLPWRACNRSSAVPWDRRWWPEGDRSLSRPAAHPRDGVRQ